MDAPHDVGESGVPGPGPALRSELHRGVHHSSAVLDSVTGSLASSSSWEQEALRSPVRAVMGPCSLSNKRQMQSRSSGSLLPPLGL